MRYSIGERVVRSENAARPAEKPCRDLVVWLQRNGPWRDALDYGCGKLRYARVLVERCERLTVVDSEVQLDRTQVIFSDLTSVRDYVSKEWKRARALGLAEFAADRRRYDFVLCANVLSAIPQRQIQRTVIESLRERLRRTGRVLFTAQYTNSYFREVAESGRAIPHLDGWLVDSLRGPAYFGVLNKEAIASLIAPLGVRVVAAWHAGQQAYVLGAP